MDIERETVMPKTCPIGKIHAPLYVTSRIDFPSPNTSLAEAFSSHGPSKAIQYPLYLGGPAEVNAVFALVATHDSPGRGSIPLSPDLFLVIAADAVDHVIEFEAKHARFFAGTVVWRPGELDDELKRGA